METLRRYSAVLGRSPVEIRRSATGRQVEVAVFPAIECGFWKGLFVEAPQYTVYMTSGVARHGSDSQLRCELMALGETLGVERDTDHQAALASHLMDIAEFVLDADVRIDLGHTIDFRSPLAANSDMTAVLLCNAAAIDDRRLARCAGAHRVLNVVPITSKELDLIRSDGIAVLLDLFEHRGVRPIYDPFRESVA